MASSGTYNFALTYGEAILAAYERCRIRAPSLRQEHFVTARRELNLLLSSWSNKQINLWKVEQIGQVLAQGTATYALPARVIDVLDAYRTLNDGDADQTDNFMTPINRTTYATYSNKNTQGPPTTYWVDRLITPEVTVWPVPDGGGPYTFNYFAVVQVQDANVASGETPDVPYRWYNALVAGLALRVGRVYADPPLLADLRTEAKEAWDEAAEEDIEDVNVQVLPQTGGYYK